MLHIKAVRFRKRCARQELAPGARLHSLLRAAPSYAPVMEAQAASRWAGAGGGPMLTAAKAAGHRASTSGKTRRQRVSLMVSMLVVTRSVLVGLLMMFWSWSKTPV